MNHLTSMQQCALYCAHLLGRTDLGSLLRSTAKLIQLLSSIAVILSPAAVLRYAELAEQLCSNDLFQSHILSVQTGLPSSL